MARNDMRRARSRLWTLALVSVIGTLVVAVPPAVGQEQTDEEAPVAPETSIEAPPTTRALALVQAANTGEPVLIDTETTTTTHVFANPDGTFTAEIASGPVRVPDPSDPSGWTPLDTTLVTAPEGLVPEATLADVTFSAGGADPLAALATGTRSLTLDWPGKLPEAKVERDTATYPEVLPGIDLVLQARPAGYAQSLVVSEPPEEPLVFVFPLDTEGLTPSVSADGNFALDAPSGKEVIGADPARMWDSATDPVSSEPVHEALVTTRIVDTDSGPALEVAPDPAFFTDELTYPVIIDPSPDLSVNKDAFVYQAFPDTSYNSDAKLKVGYSGTGTTRSLIKFNTQPISGTHVLSAELHLYETYSASCDPSRANVVRLNSSFQTPTWNDQPSYGGTVYASARFANGYDSSCPNAWASFSDGGDDGKTLEDLVQGWASGGIANYGLAVRAENEGATNSWKIFNSSDSANNIPYLSVTYNSYPKTPTGLSPASGAYVNDSTPELHGKSCDPDENKTRVNYQIYNNAGTQLQVSSPTDRARVANCTDHKWTVPGGSALSDGTYRWRAQGDDGTDTSSWTSGPAGGRQMIVDTTAPSSVTISSSSHPTQSTWYAASQDDVSASWTSSSDATSGVSGYAVIFDQSPSTIPSGSVQSGTTFTRNDVTPSGIWYLHVRPKDNAGNWGSTSTFAVHLGHAAVTSPGQGSESSELFTLDASADPSQGSVTFLYRRSPTDTTCGSSPGDWCQIPAADVGLSSWPLTLDQSGDIDALTWDASSTLGALPSTVQIRVLGGLGAASAPVDLAFVPDHTEAGAPAGPGSVDLVTGNLTLPAGDVSVFGLGVFRTLDSRTPSEPSTGIFGPGWDSGLESYSSYLSLVEDADTGQVRIETAFGQPLQYEKMQDGSYQTPAAVDGESEEPAPALSFANGVFSLVEQDGISTVFERPTGSDAFVPTQIFTPAEDSMTQTIYGRIVEGVAQPTKMIDAVPDGITGCSSGSPGAGCRILTFTYADSTTATGTEEAGWGDHIDQVRSISFTGYDPDASSMATVEVARYLYDSTGMLRAAWDPRVSPSLKTRYSYDAQGHVATLTPPGLNAWSFSYAAISGDSNTGRLSAVSRPGDPSGTATTTFVYEVPVSGTGAPYPMGSTDVDDWGQAAAPATATAVFPPGHDPSGNPPSSYEWAFIYYLDQNGRVVNTASSDGSGGAYVTSTEYTALGAVARMLTASNRERILVGVPDPSALWSSNVYSADGTDLLESFGPMHAVQLQDGTVRQAQAHVTYAYDEDAPQGAGCPCHLITTVSEGARVQGTTSDVDVRTTKTEYDWDLLSPTATITDPAGLNLRHTTLLDPETGRVTETRLPAYSGSPDPHATKYTYYQVSGSDSDCHGSSHAAWAGLLCKAAPAAQPQTGYDLPVAVFEYDLWGNVAWKTETVPDASVTRTWSFTYDDAGRLASSSVDGPGTAVPDVAYGYDSTTGLPTTTLGGGLTITRSYDDLGRLASYADADQNTSTYSYDLQDRPTSVFDGRGTYTLTYDEGDERRGLLTTLEDSQAGEFDAAYDPDGALVSQAWPNGMTSTTTFDEAGGPTALIYTKTTNCTGDCDWFTEQVVPSIHGQWLSRNSTLSSQQFTYDAAGRLVWTHDTVAAQCTTRQYGYDADSNRTSLTTRVPQADGSCDTSSTRAVVASTYDAADRATKTGFILDTFGRVTQVPGSDNPGGEMALSYFENDKVRTLSVGGATDEITRDPLGRIRQVTLPVAAQTWHYGNEGDWATWVAEDGSWTRNIVGISGLLSAIASQSGTVLLQLTSLHSDVVAAASSSQFASSPLTAADQTEFGIPREDSQERYAWLGGFQRPADGASDALMMGARVYVPSLGRFLQTDPIPGGSANAYDYATQEPIALSDLYGTATSCSYATTQGPDWKPFYLRFTVRFCSDGRRIISMDVTSWTHHEELLNLGVWRWNGFWRSKLKWTWRDRGGVIMAPEWEAGALITFHSSWCIWVSFDARGNHWDGYGKYGADSWCR